MTNLIPIGSFNLNEPIYKFLKSYSEKLGYTNLEEFISDLCTAKAMTLLGLGEEK